jgi:uncharacterized protein (TIGR00369 family)
MEETAMNVRGNIEFSVVARRNDQVISEMPIHDGIKNPFGVVHAGAMLWFADVTATLLVIGDSTPQEGMKGFPLAISLNAHFLSNQREGQFRAVSSFVRKGRTVSVVRTVVYGKADRIIADVTTSHVLSS